jgi:hypothetical protein
MTQFQQSASVRPLDTTERAYPAPFLAIAAGLIAVLMAVAVISFALDALPSDATIGANTDTAAVDGYMAGLTAANHQRQLEGAALAMRRPITSTDGQQRLESAQRLRDGWAGALVVQRASDPVDGWEAAQIRPHAPAVDGYIQRFINAE